MKIIAIGDTHGRSNWKRISNQKFDKLIFIGDYFDTHEGVTAHEQIENFKDIVTYKKVNPDKVILLIGNHDFHYLSEAKEHYSGFQPLHEFDIRELLEDALKDKLLQVCHVHDGFIFSHAGVTKTWCRNTFGYEPLKEDVLESDINELFYHKPSNFRFTPGERFDNYGNEICQTPIWVRPYSLLKDRIDNYIQVVGHTTQKELALTEDVILIDTLGTSKEYLIVEDGITSIGRN